jgi:D-alanyl-lipoteichoic acid acyltransferase DltB (MBOAT superfamily)
VPKFLLPVGISFFTFQAMSYTIDVYRGQLKAARSYPDFLLFVTFFPQLVAGPIVRASDVPAAARRETAVRRTSTCTWPWGSSCPGSSRRR